MTARRIRAASRRAHSPTLPVERKHHEARQKGNLNPGGGEGTWGTTGGREQVWGQGLGGLQIIPPWFPLNPNLEDAQMRQRHAARVQRPYGQNPTATRPRLRGHTREHNCRPHGRDTEDTLAPAISQSCSWTLFPGTFSGTWMGNLVSLMPSAYDSPTLRGPSFIRVGLAGL